MGACPIIWGNTITATTSAVLLMRLYAGDPWENLAEWVVVTITIIWLYSSASIIYSSSPTLWRVYKKHRQTRNQRKAAMKLTAVQKRLLARLGTAKASVDVTSIPPRDLGCTTLIEIKVAAKGLREKGLASSIRASMPNRIKLTERGLVRASEIFDSWKEMGDTIFCDD